jgi:chitin synthase
MASTSHSQANLVALPAHSQSDTGLTSHIASRYHAQLPISNLSSQAIVSINTYTSSSRGPNGGKEGSAMGSMEELASRIWTRLGSRQENQAAVYLYVVPKFHTLHRTSVQFGHASALPAL